MSVGCDLMPSTTTLHSRQPSSTQSTMNSYQAILQDLNREVARSQPEDVWQFCANWFNAKLEEQRIAGRLSIASTKSSILASPSSSGIKKKGSLPSLTGQGYTFGSSSTSPGAERAGVQFSNTISDSGAPSPYSEIPPGMRVPSTIPPVPSTRTNSGSINWNKSFGAAAAASAMDNDSDEENAGMQHENTPTATSHGRGSHSSESRDRLAALPNGSANNNNNINGGNVSPVRGHFNPDAPSSGIPSGINLGRRTSVSAESINPNALSTSAHPLPKTVIPKTASQRARIESSIEKNLLFRNLDEEQHDDILNAMKEVRVTKGMEVIVQGAVGDFFYVVESGEFQVWVKPKDSISSTSGGTTPPRSRSSSAAPASTEDEEARVASGQKNVATISAGGSFGELALMYNAPRAATVLCSSPSATLWALDRVTFRTILMEHTSKKRRMYEKFLAEVPILVSLEPHERSKIADALEERVYEEGEDVVREGELGKNFYIIESGRAEVLKRKGSSNTSERVGTLSKGDYFGELALLNSAPRAATVRPLPGSGRLRVATLGEKAFTRLLGPVVEILTRRAERNYGSTATSTSAPASSSRSAGSNGEKSGNGYAMGPRGEGRELRSALKSGGTARGSRRESERDREDSMMQE